jgi:hypothetical protein
MSEVGEAVAPLTEVAASPTYRRMLVGTRERAECEPREPAVA